MREIPAGVIASPDSIKEWLATFLGERKTAEFLLAYAVCRNGKRLPETIQEALDFSRRRQGRSSKHWMKILFLLDANAAGDWYRQTPVGARVDTENRCDASLSPHLWTRSALEQRLHQLEKISSPQACQAILSATGGWPILVDELFRRVGQEPNPASFAEQVKKELGENHSPLRKSFIESIGLRGMAATSDVLNLFLEIPLDEEDLESFPEYLQEHLGKRIDRDLALNTVEYLKSMRVLGTQGVKLQLNEIVRQLL